MYPIFDLLIIMKLSKLNLIALEKPCSYGVVGVVSETVRAARGSPEFSSSRLSRKKESNQAVYSLEVAWWIYALQVLLIPSECQFVSSC